MMVGGWWVWMDMVGGCGVVADVDVAGLGGWLAWVAGWLAAGWLLLACFLDVYAFYACLLLAFFLPCLLAGFLACLPCLLPVLSVFLAWLLACALSPLAPPVPVLPFFFPRLLLLLPLSSLSLFPSSFLLFSSFLSLLSHPLCTFCLFLACPFFIITS